MTRVTNDQRGRVGAKRAGEGGEKRMIKFKFTGKGDTPGLGFGLSAENVKRLQAGQPIFIDCSEMGVNVQVTVFYGETEQAIYEDLKEFIGKDTKVHGV